MHRFVLLSFSPTPVGSHLEKARTSSLRLVMAVLTSFRIRIKPLFFIPCAVCLHRRQAAESPGYGAREGVENAEP